MFEVPVLNENNEKILCEMNGKNADMLMNVKVKYMKAGESFSLCDENNETAVLLVAGEVKFTFSGRTETGTGSHHGADQRDGSPGTVCQRVYRECQSIHRDAQTDTRTSSGIHPVHRGVRKGRKVFPHLRQ